MKRLYWYRYMYSQAQFLWYTDGISVFFLSKKNLYRAEPWFSRGRLYMCYRINRLIKLILFFFLQDLG